MRLTNEEIENKLIEEAKDITPDILDRIKSTPYTYIEKNNRLNRNKLMKLAISFCLIFICIFIISGSVVYGKEYETLSIDVNPSIEFKINRFDRIIAINYNNDEAYNIFNNLNLKNKNISKAIILCYEELNKNNYLDSEENIIILSGYGKNHEYDENKLNKYCDMLEQVCKNDNKNCIFQTNKVTQEQKEIASENNISYGKLKMINLIIALTNDYSFDELKLLSMKELKDIYKEYR